MTSARRFRAHRVLPRLQRCDQGHMLAPFKESDVCRGASLDRKETRTASPAHQHTSHETAASDPHFRQFRSPGLGALLVSAILLTRRLCAQQRLCLRFSS